MSFKILSIDGGGIRGVVPAHILNCIQERLGISLSEKIDMVSGTSTGSIIASAIACNISVDKVLTLYKTQGEKIFPSRFSLFKKLKPAFSSVYNNQVLYDVLSEQFGNRTLADVKKPLIIPATDIGNGIVHVFKSSYSTNFTRDNNRLVKDAVMASCSAPTFFNPTKVDNYLLSDGGLWANNPSLVAFIDAQRRLGVDKKDIKILTIGTGHSKKHFGTNAKKKWGFMTGWKRLELINFIMSLQSQAVSNYLNLSLDASQILRIDFDTDLRLPLDDYKIINDLISTADKEFTYNSEKIKDFFL